MKEQPLTMKESTVAMHEVYINLKEAGFTRREALVILTCYILDKPLEP